MTRRIDGSACIKVIDFGIATHLGGRDEPGMVLGSPGYMAPEQLMGSEHIGVQADIWALGLILCELATGLMPFEPNDRLWWLAGRQPPRPMSLLRPGLPSALDGVLARCLNPDLSARYASVEDFSEALADAAPDSCPPSAERISRITNLVRESQRAVALAEGSFLDSTGPKPIISGARSAPEATGECRPLDRSAASPRDPVLNVHEGSQTVREGQPGNRYEE
jgi:serine/threonine-protein kinase